MAMSNVDVWSVEGAIREDMNQNHPRILPPRDDYPGWIAEDEPAAIVFNQTLKAVMQMFEENHVAFEAIALFQSPSGPTVTITCKRIPENAHEIEAMARQEYYPAEMFPCFIFRQSSVERARYLDLHHYSRSPTLGVSLGVNGVDWSVGTFGGYLFPVDESDHQVYGLTCHHVLAPTLLDSTELSESTSTGMLLSYGSLTSFMLRVEFRRFIVNDTRPNLHNASFLRSIVHHASSDEETKQLNAIN